MPRMIQQTQMPMGYHTSNRAPMMQQQMAMASMVQNVMPMTQSIMNFGGPPPPSAPGPPGAACYSNIQYKKMSKKSALFGGNDSFEYIQQREAQIS